ncbi:FIVAR domain-containing protein [Cellulomonas dongxiuzhuiae]|uniref:FIVAR domain-containing protein n=1 Tax=Cellulomonas dongxiuzhuiae TaxID=2819979 RepID=A0ABX8GIE2_9CELL|nr:FIVAR domain-containing protein [Cellulomonas dongxiuzhuiae]MBO3094393.1 FIVAR domain-containing protein [Cellulomonas dongxiuzhuiae]QWC15421.1 FIVAR domain-containing protein [Cellulomonas dongxiuzhuiae]
MRFPHTALAGSKIAVAVTAAALVGFAVTPAHAADGENPVKVEIQANTGAERIPVGQEYSVTFLVNSSADGAALSHVELDYHGTVVGLPTAVNCSENTLGFFYTGTPAIMVSGENVDCQITFTVRVTTAGNTLIDSSSFIRNEMDVTGSFALTSFSTLTLPLTTPLLIDSTGEPVNVTFGLAQIAGQPVTSVEYVLARTAPTYAVVASNRLTGSPEQLTFSNLEDDATYTLTLVHASDHHSVITSSAPFGLQGTNANLLAMRDAELAKPPVALTAASNTKRQAALDAVDQVPAVTTRKAINEAEAAFTDVMNSLIPTAPMTAALNNAQNTLATGSYASWSQDQVTSRMGALLLLMGDRYSTATPADADSAVAALNQAVDDLLDTSAFDEAIATVAGLNKADYTQLSWISVEIARQDARAVINQLWNTPVDIARANLAAALTNLYRAIDDLANPTDLQAALAHAHSITSTHYTTSSWDAFQDAIDAASDTLTGWGTATDFAAAVAALELAETNLVDSRDAHIALADVAGLSASDYTPASWAALQAAIDTVNARLVGPGSAADLAAAVAALELAEANLVDPRDAQTALADVAALSPGDYTPASWAALQAAIDTVNGLLAGSGSTADLAAAVTALELAEANLVDPRAAQEAVADVATLTPGSYTPASWAALQAAIDAANGLLAGPAASAADLAVAVAAIDAARANLVLSASDAPAPPPAQGTAVTGEQAAAVTVSELPRTGAQLGWVALSALLMILAGAALRATGRKVAP